MNDTTTIEKLDNFRTFTAEEVRDIVDTMDSVSTSSWRWGKVNHYIVEKDGFHWMVPVRFHVEEGLQDEDAYARKVVQVTKTVTVWENA